jgi:PAT family beta-lactamase induction signal transducer AmpG
MTTAEIRQVHPARWIPTLYFAEGLPFVIVGTVSALMYKSMGISDAEIAFFTSLAMWPWTFKPLWGPLLEMFKTKKHFVVGTQLVGGITLCLLLLALPLPGFFRYSLALFALLAFTGATHDIAADGVYVNVLTPKQQDQFVGWLGAFYNLARVLSGGAFVYLAGQLEIRIGIVSAWMIVMGAFGAILILISLYHLKVLPSGGAATTDIHSSREAFARFWDVVTSFFRKRNIAWGIAFIVLFRFAEGQAVKIVPLFLRAAREQGGLGLSTSDVGIIYGTFGAAAFILGSILGGYFTAARGLRRSLFILCCFFNIPFAVYAFLSSSLPTNFFIIAIAVVFEYFGYGFGFVGLTLFMMQQIAPGQYKMAHYAFATGLMSLGMMIPSMLSGFMSDYLGYRHFFLWVLIATIPSFLVTWFVPFSEPEPELPAGQAP